jgi:hypothetical protein
MHNSGISIWFFIGVLLSIYGVLILGYGLFELVSGQTAPVVLAYLHAPVWWGALLLALGLFYGVRFRPGRNH